METVGGEPKVWVTAPRGGEAGLSHHQGVLCLQRGNLGRHIKRVGMEERAN